MFGKRKTAKEKSDALKSTEPVITTAQAESSRNDAALIAVIAAAIAASLGTSANGIVIRSLRRSRPSTPKWGAAGREQQIYHQF
jgi:hypothetical protein